MRIKLMLAIMSFVVAATTNAMFFWWVPDRDLGIPRDGCELVVYLGPQDNLANVLPYVMKIECDLRKEIKDLVSIAIDPNNNKSKLIGEVANLSDPMDVYMFLAGLEREDSEILWQFLKSSFNPGKSYVKRIADTAKAAAQKASTFVSSFFQSKTAEIASDAQGEGAGPNISAKANILKAIAQEPTWIAKLILIMIEDSKEYSISSTKVLDHIERMLPSFEGEVDGATVSEGNDLVFTGKKVPAESTPRAQRSLRRMKECLMLFLGSAAKPGEEKITLNEVKDLIVTTRGNAENTKVTDNMIETVRSLAYPAQYDPNDPITTAGYESGNRVYGDAWDFKESAEYLYDNAMNTQPYIQADKNKLVKTVKTIIETGLKCNPEEYQKAAYSLVFIMLAIDKMEKDLKETKGDYFRRGYIKQVIKVMKNAFDDVKSKLLNSWIIANVLVNQDLQDNCYNPSKQLPLNYHLKRLLSAWNALETSLKRPAMKCIMEVIKIILNCIDQKAEVTISGVIMNRSNALELIENQTNLGLRYKMLQELVQSLPVAANPKTVHDQLNEKLKTVYEQESLDIKKTEAKKGGKVEVVYIYPQWSILQDERPNADITMSYTRINQNFIWV